ncbi:MAG: SCO family protein [Massilia sp.]
MRRRVERQLARARRWHWVTVGVLVCLVAAATAHAGTGDTLPSAPLQQFVAPAPGSYQLERIQKVPKGTVLDERGRAQALANFTTDKITLLGFIYTYCVDPIGCPLAFCTFTSVREKVAADPLLARRVRLVSMSFDPTNDTPEAMLRYAGKLADEAGAPRWHFLTSRSVDELKPIIDDFGQDVAVQRDDKGRATRLFHHMLKVFLIDPQGQVREIYSTAYLMPEVMFNDIRTLALEREGREGR